MFPLLPELPPPRREGGELRESGGEGALLKVGVGSKRLAANIQYDIFVSTGTRSPH